MEKVDIATSTDDINHNNNITNFDQIGNDNDIGIIKQKIKICKIFKYASIGKIKIIFAPWSSNIFLLIGPQWYLFILLILIAIPSFIFFYIKIFPLLLSSFFRHLILIIVLITLTLYTIVFLIDPGVITKNTPDTNDPNNNEKCIQCNLQYSKALKCLHCSYCDVCIENMDHHCIWVGKCIGKRTKKYFYIMLANVSLMYIILILSVIKYFISK